MGFGDGRLQRLDGVGLGLEVLGDEVVIGDERVVPAGGDDSLEVVADLLPPVDEDAGTLELVEHAQRHELGLEGGEQLVANLGHLLAAVARMLELGEVVPGDRPPGFEGVVVPGESAQQRRGRFERGPDGGPGVDGPAKGEVGGTLRLEE